MGERGSDNFIIHMYDKVVRGGGGENRSNRTPPHLDPLPRWGRGDPIPGACHPRRHVLRSCRRANSRAGGTPARRWKGGLESGGDVVTMPGVAHEPAAEFHHEFISDLGIAGGNSGVVPTGVVCLVSRKGH